ncbi:MAG: J domain-containing protein [Oscillospiraceae bacterium]|nr:J domain-containing protein [Oscillospiraceae bacterium]
MGNLLESYRVLGVKVGAGMADVTSSYRRLCREYHPDISDDPAAEELMKQINIAYTVLRDKFKREESFRSRQTFTRPVKRYPAGEPRQSPPPPPPRQSQQPPPPRHTQQPPPQPQRKTSPSPHQDARAQAAEAHRQKTAERVAVSQEAEEDAREVLHNYFVALNSFDYEKSYGFLSAYDKKNITLEAFIKWRESVARLYPMREFQIAGGSSVAVITWGGDKSFHARKFRVMVTEDDYTDNKKQSGDIDKLVINEDGNWGVFLGYKEVTELTRSFDKRFESKRKSEVEKRWEEYKAGFHPEFDMLNLDGMKKQISRELYRQRRYGGSMTFAAVSVKSGGEKNTGQAELLRSAAKTISDALREIDVPAYAGDGIFAIMYVELGKRSADAIISRLVETIRKNAGPQLGTTAEIEYEYGSWSGQVYADTDTLNGILIKFGKKI